MTKKGLSRRDFLRGGTTALLAGMGLAGCGTGGSDTPPEAAESPESDYVPGEDGELGCDDAVNEVSLRILWTGDTHGQLRPIYHREVYGEKFLDFHGIEKGSPEAYLTSSLDFVELAGKYGKVGGYAHIATLVERERSEYPDRTLLLDSGDAIYGSAIAMLTEGQAGVAVMNAMGYDALTLHWEFNLGKEALFACIEQAEFEVLAQNLVDTDFEDRILEPSMIREMSGLRVAIVGQAYPFSMLTTEDQEANPGMRMGYRDIELQAEIDRLRNEENIDLLILLSHMGYEQDKLMAERLTGVDVIVGGHTHDILWKPQRVNGVILLQGGSHGKFLGKLDLEVRDGEIVGCHHELLPVIANDIDPDPDVQQLIDEFYAPYEADLGREIGETATILYRRSLFGGTTDEFLARAYRDIAGTELGCAPGWRFGTTLLPGPVTAEDIYNAMKPTASPLYTVHLKGKFIREIMEDNLDNVFNPDPLLRLGGDSTRCAGMKADLNRDAPREERTSNLEVNGEAFDPERVYTIGTSGGRTQNRDPESVATDHPAVEAVIAFIEAMDGPIEAAPVHVYTETA